VLSIQKHELYYSITLSRLPNAPFARVNELGAIQVKPTSFISPGNFAGPTIPYWLIGRREISAGAKLLYCYLSEHTCHPDYPEYFVASGLHQRKIAKSWASLSGPSETGSKNLKRRF
jgi:hypothetical protein